MKTLIIALAVITILSCKSRIVEYISKDVIIGDYVSRDGYEYRLWLTNDEFKYWKNYGHGSDFTRGQWIIDGNKIILQSKELDNDEKFLFTLSSGRWIVFNNKVFEVKNNLLKEIEDGKITLVKK